MTPKRKAALQWLHDVGEATPQQMLDTLGRRMFSLMQRERQIEAKQHRKLWTWNLTDKGRRDLHEG